MKCLLMSFVLTITLLSFVGPARILDPITPGIYLERQGSVIIGVQSKLVTIKIKLPILEDMIPEITNLTMETKIKIKESYQRFIKSEISAVHEGNSKPTSGTDTSSKPRVKRVAPIAVGALVVGSISLLNGAISSYMAYVNGKRIEDLTSGYGKMRDALTEDERVFNSHAKEMIGLKDKELRMTSLIQSISTDLLNLKRETIIKSAVQLRLFTEMLIIKSEFDRLRDNKFPTRIVDQEIKDQLHKLLDNPSVKYTIDDLTVVEVNGDETDNSLSILIEVPDLTKSTVYNYYRCLSVGSLINGSVFSRKVPEFVFYNNGTWMDIWGDCEMFGSFKACLNPLIEHSCINNIEECKLKENVSKMSFFKYKNNKVTIRPKDSKTYIIDNSGARMDIPRGIHKELLLDQGDQLFLDGEKVNTEVSFMQSTGSEFVGYDRSDTTNLIDNHREELEKIRQELINSPELSMMKNDLPSMRNYMTIHTGAMMMIWIVSVLVLTIIIYRIVVHLRKPLQSTNKRFLNVESGVQMLLTKIIENEQSSTES